MIVFQDRENSFLYSLRLSISLPNELPVNPFLEEFQESILGDLHVSPDGKWLVFRASKPDGVSTLVLSTGDAQERRVIPWNIEDWGNSILGWLADSQRLILTSIDVDKYAATPNSLVVLNPFTLHQQQITPSFSYKIPLFYWYWYPTNVLYDPTLSRIVYLENGPQLVLWDVENQRELWRIYDLYVDEFPPLWSPDGAYMAFLMSSTNEENDLLPDTQLSVIKRDGGELMSVAVSQEGLDIFNWSPDGHYLAYWLSQQDYTVRRLFLFDLVTGQSLDTCITYSASGGGDWPPRPVWSPSSTQFIVRVQTKPKTSTQPATYETLVMDVLKNVVARLDIEFDPVGWLTQEP
jgi:Tol biopolymer transport system component